MKLNDLPTDVDERLWEWAYFFRDRKRLETCRSIENRFRATSEDFAAEGWGDTEAAPKINPGKSYRLPRAVETHEAILKLDVIYRWVLTYGFCYPSLPRFVVLRAVKRFTGRRLSWNAYLDALDIGRVRVYSMLR